MLFTPETIVVILFFSPKEFEEKLLVSAITPPALMLPWLLSMSLG
jgi:hypothetical protein